jgi:hypothetical protein
MLHMLFPAPQNQNNSSFIVDQIHADIDPLVHMQQDRLLQQHPSRREFGPVGSSPVNPQCFSLVGIEYA